MPKQPRPTLLTGTVQDILFSPKGEVEGVMLKSNRETVQGAMPPDVGLALTRKSLPGKRLRLFALQDKSPRATQAAHAVYKFSSMANASGEAVDLPEDAGSSAIKGKVARIHYAKHGEPNGVVLDSGEFIHLRPHGFEALGLDVGSKISARGALKTTILGNPLLEAHSANGYEIEQSSLLANA